MKNLKINLLYGLLVRLVPFIAGFIIFPLRSSDRVFFESLMSLILVFVTVWAVAKVRNKEALHIWQTGLLWLIISIILDLCFFTWGPQKMAFSEYWTAIGVGYLAIPVIAWLAYRPKSQEEKVATPFPELKL